MHTPIQRKNGSNNTGPSSTFLRQLLNDITGEDTTPPASSRDSRRSSAASYTSSHRSSRRASSAWIGGTSIATDARDKLRAADEARQRKASMNGNHKGSEEAIPPILPVMRPDNPETSRAASFAVNMAVPGLFGQDDRDYFQPRRTGTDSAHFRSLGFDTDKLFVPDEVSPGDQSPLMFCDADSDMDLSSTPSPTGLPSLTAGTSIPESTLLSTPSPSDGDKLSKKMRSATLPQLPSQPLSDSSRGSIGDNRFLIRSSTFTERAVGLRSDDAEERIDTLPELSSFRPSRVSPQGPPVINIQSPSRRASTMSFSPPDTPIFARRMHLVDSNLSIHHQAHGDEWQEYALCLPCFRLQGRFNRVQEHGYELCGGFEVLDRYYWEDY